LFESHVRSIHTWCYYRLCCEPVLLDGYDVTRCILDGKNVPRGGLGRLRCTKCTWMATTCQQSFRRLQCKWIWTVTMYPRCIWTATMYQEAFGRLQCKWIWTVKMYQDAFGRLPPTKRHFCSVIVIRFGGSVVSCEADLVFSMQQLHRLRFPTLFAVLRRVG
jgi:hypothetical protein